MIKNVIWDLSGTLFRPQSQGMSQDEIADYSFVFLMWSGKKEPSRLDTIAYKMLGFMGEQTNTDPTQIIKDHTGKPVPEIICSYLAGSLDSGRAWQQTLSFFDSWAPEHLDHNDQALVKRMLQIFFDPHALAYCMKPIEPAVELLQKTAEHNDNLYVLSNWDKDSFGPFYHKYKDSVLSVFKRNHIVISADTGYVKPQRGIYQWLVSHKHLDPSTCFFIDDQEENIKAAQDYGLHGIQFKEDRIDALNDALKKRGLI